MAKKKKKKAKKKVIQRTKSRCTYMGRVLGRAEGALLDAYSLLHDGERESAENALSNAADDLDKVLDEGPDGRVNRAIKAVARVRKSLGKGGTDPAHELAPRTLAIAEDVRYIDPKGCK